MTERPSVWPMPTSLSWASGSWAVPELVRVRVTHPGVELPDLIDVLRPLRAVPAAGDVDLTVAQADVPLGGYDLDVAPEGVVIGVHDRAGLVAAVTTLKQLMPADVWRPAASREGWRVPAVTVQDAPAYAWRGFMLDVARHFLPVNDLLRVLDVLAMHKLNVLHLHLSDDQGWRIESSDFPRLNEVACWRPETPILTPLTAARRGVEPSWDGTPHGGIYSRADLRAITDHARRLGITVVPEVDLPGHSGALLAGIPELATSVTPRREHADTARQSALSTVSPLPAARDILDRLLAEVCEAVQSPWLHLGGDEADLSDWRTAPEVQQYMTTQGLPDVTSLRRDLNQHLAEAARQLGRRPVFWDEAFVAGGLPADVVIMAWRGVEVARRAAATGHDVVLAPVDPLYLDYADTDSAREPRSIGHGIDLAGIAEWEVPSGQWLGVHAPLWTEHVPDVRTLHYRAFPKLSIVAAAAWTGRRTPWPNEALRSHLERLKAAGVEYRPLEGPHPWQEGGTGARRAHGGIPIAVVRTMLERLSTQHELTAEDLQRLLDEEMP